MNCKLINGINWKILKYEEIIGWRIFLFYVGNIFCCIYVYLYILYVNLFLCFYNMIWDIIFRMIFKVIWYRVWLNWVCIYYIWIDCWYLVCVFWDFGILYLVCIIIWGVDWCSVCFVLILVIICVGIWI